MAKKDYGTELSNKDSNLFWELRSLSANQQEYARALALLPHEIGKFKCKTCNKIAFRIFKPNKRYQRQINYDYEKELKSMDKSRNKNTPFIRTPNFNLLLSNGHHFASPNNFANSSNTSYYGVCKNGLLLVTNPRKIITSLITKLDFVRNACLINDIKYSEISDWFAKQSFSILEMLASRYLTIEEVLNEQDGNLSLPDRNYSTPEPEIGESKKRWYMISIAHSLLSSIDKPLLASNIGSDSEWDSNLDYNFEPDFKTRQMTYGPGSFHTSFVPEIIGEKLIYLYEGSSTYHLVLIPKNRPDLRVLSFNDSSFKTDSLNIELAHFVHLFPKEFWTVPKERVDLVKMQDKNFVDKINLKQDRIVIESI